MLKEEFNIKDYIIKYIDYDNFQHLFDNSTVQLEGYGFFSIHQEDHYLNYYLFYVNYSVVSIITKSTNQIKFNESSELINFCLFDSSLIEESKIFTNNDSINFYKDFQVDIPVDFKFYNYEELSKILISKSGANNIDLYLEVLIHIKENNLFKIRITPSLEPAIKKMKLIQALNRK